MTKKFIYSMWLTTYSPSGKEVKAGTQSTNLEAGTETEAEEELCVLAYGSFSLLSFIAQGHLPRGGTTHRDLSSPTSISNHDNTPQTFPQTNLREADLQLRFLFK